MSAITGIYYLDQRLVEPQLLETMTEILAHRGSDDANIWAESSMGLGHRMRWTTPESLVEKLPFTSDNGELVITADARIDNRQELISLLEVNQLPQGKITDSQLILASYQKWGESCVEKLLGDFAFAIWDKPQQILFCARDHFGVKPFYYYYSEPVFVFASEIKGLFGVPEVPRQLNEARVGEFLASTLHDKESTYYQDILRLPPAHTMTVSKAGVTKKSYWSLDPEYELKLDSEAEYVAQFKNIFAEAVRCRLRSAYPIGSMLSGGLDSSSITCMAQKILQATSEPNLHTFSFVFEEVPESDESPFINAVVAQTGVQPHYIKGSQSSPLTDIKKLIWHQDEPIFAPNLYLNWQTYQMANQLGVRIILDGFDGDTTISHGIGYLRELALANRWIKFISEVRALSRNLNRSFGKMLWSYLEAYRTLPLLGKSKITRFFWDFYDRFWQKKIAGKFKQDTPQVSWTSILNPQFIAKINLRKRRKALLQERYGVSTTEREEHYRAINNGLLPATLEILDKTAAPFAVELRYPFWDKRLVEFCLSVPTEQKMNLGWTRMILRRGMEGILPQEIQWRGGKGNLSPGLEYGLETFEKSNLEEMRKQLKLIDNYVNTYYLEYIYQDFISNINKVNDVMSIWKSLNLILWLKYTNLLS